MKYSGYVEEFRVKAERLLIPAQPQTGTRSTSIVTNDQGRILDESDYYPSTEYVFLGANLASADITCHSCTAAQVRFNQCVSTNPDNIQATHWWCNEEKGSSRVD